jgi:hypothetical protein
MAKSPEERAAKRAAAVEAGLTTGSAAPAFVEGNDVALSYGAYAPAVVTPRAESMLEELLEDPDFPEYAKARMSRPLLLRLCQVRVRIALWWEAVEDQGVGAGDEVTLTQETVTGGGESGPMKRRGRSVKSTPAEETLRRWVAQEEKLCTVLGLTPVARARMGRDVSAAASSLADLWKDGEPS